MCGTNARAPESHTLHLGRDLCRERQGAAAGSSVHDRRAALAHRPHEVHELTAERLLLLDGNLTALDFRPLAVPTHQPPTFDLLCGVVDRQVGVRLEETN